MSRACRAAALCLLLALVGCGTGHGTTAGAVGGGQQLAGLVSITSPFVGNVSIPFTIVAGGPLSSVAGGNAVTVRFTASMGTPFLGGTSATIEVPGTLATPTTVTGNSPLADLLVPTTANVVVILPTGLAAGGAVATFNPPPGRLVINEVDYDQVSTDTAEYIELYNAGPGPFDLTNVEVRLIQGFSGGSTTYRTITLPNVILPPNDFFLIGANANVVGADLLVNVASNMIQNGSPDAVGLFDNNTNTLLDAVSYEGASGAPYTEGTGTTAADSNTTANVSLSRTTDGVDTNNNDADFTLKTATPGATNG